MLAVEQSIGKSKGQAVAALIKLLKTSSERETQWLIGKLLGAAKDERVIRPLIRAVQLPANSTHCCNFLWPLENYDCTKHLDTFVKMLLSRDDYDEVVWACIEIIRAMKGPFEPATARKNVRRLLAEPKQSLPEATRIALAAFRLEAAESIMAKYFNNTLKTFWKDWNND